jgi:cytochrome c5
MSRIHLIGRALARRLRRLGRVRFRLLLLAAVAAGAAALALPALAAPQEGDAGDAQPSTRRAKAPRPEPPPVDGSRVFRETCGRCHNARQPDELPLARWDTVLAHMRVRGGLPARDLEALKAWLEATLAPPPPSVSGAGPPLDFPALARERFPEIPLLAERCTLCHSPELIANAVDAGHDAGWWEATTRRMVGNGASVSEEERRVIAAALAERARRADEAGTQ